MNKNKKAKETHELKEVEAVEVSLVPAAANQVRFLVIKSKLGVKAPEDGLEIRKGDEEYVADLVTRLEGIAQEINRFVGNLKAAEFTQDGEMASNLEEAFFSPEGSGTEPEPVDGAPKDFQDLLKVAADGCRSLVWSHPMLSDEELFEMLVQVEDVYNESLIRSVPRSYLSMVSSDIRGLIAKANNEEQRKRIEQTADLLEPKEDATERYERQIAELTGTLNSLKERVQDLSEQTHINSELQSLVKAAQSINNKYVAPSRGTAPEDVPQEKERTKPRNESEVWDF